MWGSVLGSQDPCSSARTMEQYICPSVMGQKIKCRENPGGANLNFWKTSSPHPGTDRGSLPGQAGMSAAWEAALLWAGQGARDAQGSQAQRGALCSSCLS